MDSFSFSFTFMLCFIISENEETSFITSYVVARMAAKKIVKKSLSTVTATAKKKRSPPRNNKKMRKRGAKPPKKKKKLFTCEICANTKIPSSNMFNNANRCTHPVCCACIASHVRAKLHDNVYYILCPFSCISCTELLDPHSCQPHLPSDIFMRWCDLLLDAALMSLNKCTCPNGDCSEVVLDECSEDRGETERAECPACHNAFCFKCKVAWGHCEDQVEMEKQNELFLKLAESKSWKKCPNCGIHVELYEGCNSIRCRCGTMFCYGCGKRYCQACHRP